MGNVDIIEEEVERVDKISGRLMRAATLLTKVNSGTPLRTALQIIEEARSVVEDIDWQGTENALVFYCDQGD